MRCEWRGLREEEEEGVRKAWGGGERPCMRWPSKTHVQLIIFRIILHSTNPILTPSHPRFDESTQGMLSETPDRLRGRRGRAAQSSSPRVDVRANSGKREHGDTLGRTLTARACVWRERARHAKTERTSRSARDIVGADNARSKTRRA